MYNMVVTRDGTTVHETAAMKALQQYRRVDNHPTIRHPALLYPGRSFTTNLDVGDYYNMTQPGTYKVTVTRPSLPFHPPYSTQVRSNTITMTVPPQAAAAQNAQTPPKPQPRFNLNLSSNDPYGTPPPSTLTVEMDNISNRVIRIAKCWPFMGMYNFVVTRDGQPVPPTKDMLRLQSSRDAVTCPGNDTTIEIKPGDTYADDVPIGDFYNVSQPGVYQIYATRQTHPWNPARSTLVQSNSISFQVQ